MHALMPAGAVCCCVHAGARCRGGHGGGGNQPHAQGKIEWVLHLGFGGASEQPLASAQQSACCGADCNASAGVCNMVPAAHAALAHATLGRAFLALCDEQQLLYASLQCACVCMAAFCVVCRLHRLFNASLLPNDAGPTVRTV